MANNINKKELQVGDMFFIKIHNIYAMSIDLDTESYNLTEFELAFSKINIQFKDFEDSHDYYNSITMVKYIGDNKFIEYYTNKIIRKQEMITYDYNNQFEFLKAYNEYINISLLIADNNLISLLNTEDYLNYLEQFAIQDVEKIGNLIEGLEIQSKENLTYSLEQMKQQDEILAYAENCVYEFANREVPKL